MSKYNKTTLTMRLIWALLGIFFVTMIISQLYIFFNDSIKTEVALLYDTTESILFKGIFIRNERLISANHSGVIAYTHNDGTKLAKNSVVAECYNNRRDILIQAKIEQIENQIEILKGAEILINTDNSQIDSLSNQITANHSSFAKQMNEGNFENIISYKNNFLSLQAKKEIVRGTYKNFDDKISNLNSEIANLRSQITKTPQNVIITDSGYFVSNVDGYENKINIANVDDYSKDALLDIIQTPHLNVSDNVIGKMVDEYKWLLVAVLDVEKTRSMYVGYPVMLRVGSSSKVIESKIKKVNKLEDGTAIVIFECDKLGSEFLKSRTAQFRLLLEKHQGIRIPRNAIRFDENGDSGVYIKSGIEVNFVKINILMNEEEFLIVENTTNSPGYLSLYDLVIVEGKNLFEGKIING